MRDVSWCSISRSSLMMAFTNYDLKWSHRIVKHALQFARPLFNLGIPGPHFLHLAASNSEQMRAQLPSLLPKTSVQLQLHIAHSFSLNRHIFKSILHYYRPRQPRQPRTVEALHPNSVKNRFHKVTKCMLKFLFRHTT